MAPHAVREAFAAFRRTPLLNFLSAAMVGLALFVLGLFGVATHNLRIALSSVEERVEVVAFVRDGTPRLEIEHTMAELEGLPEVREIRIVSKEDALRTARTELPEIGELAVDLEANPFPASLELVLAEAARDPETVRAIAEDLSVLPFVDDVRYGREWVEKLFLIRRIAGVTAAVIGGAFAVVAALIIGTAIRIAIFARRDEVQIMRLVGATHGFIRRPFLLEGALTGLLGGTAAVALTWACHLAVDRYLFDIQWIPAEWVGMGIAGGTIFGVLSSGMAVRKHLREV